MIVKHDDSLFCNCVQRLCAQKQHGRYFPNYISLMEVPVRTVHRTSWDIICTSQSTTKIIALTQHLHQIL